MDEPGGDPAVRDRVRMQHAIGDFVAEERAGGKRPRRGDSHRSDSRDQFVDRQGREVGVRRRLDHRLVRDVVTRVVIHAVVAEVDRDLFDGHPGSSRRLSEHHHRVRAFGGDEFDDAIPGLLAHHFEHHGDQVDVGRRIAREGLDHHRRGVQVGAAEGFETGEEDLHGEEEPTGWTCPPVPERGEMAGPAADFYDSTMIPTSWSGSRTPA